MKQRTPTGPAALRPALMSILRLTLRPSISPDGVFTAIVFAILLLLLLWNQWIPHRMMMGGFFSGISSAFAATDGPGASADALFFKAQPLEKPSEELLKLRDPFKRPTIAASKEVPKSELELIPVEQLKMVGALNGPLRMRAMLLAPTGKTFLVSENQKIGVRKGVIKRISTQAIIVREKILNILGVEETVDVEIKLPPEKGGALTQNGGGP